jgi:hypothetical protein
VTVTEGRFTIEMKARDEVPRPTRQAALEIFGIPTFVGHAHRAGDAPGSIRVTRMSTENPEYVAECLLGVPNEEGGSPGTTGTSGQGE